MAKANSKVLKATCCQNLLNIIYFQFTFQKRRFTFPKKNLLSAELDKREAYCCPDELSKTNHEGNKGGTSRWYAESGYRHKETAFPTPQLKGNEKEEIGKEGGEGKNKNTLYETHLGHKDKEDEINLQRRYYSADKFKENSRYEGLWILSMKGRNLAVNSIELLFMGFYERTRPTLEERDMSGNRQYSVSQPFTIASHKEPES